MTNPLLFAFLLGVFLPDLAAAGLPAGVPDIEGLKTRNPSTTALIELRRKEARREGKAFRPYRVWTNLQEISPHLQNAVLAAEDDRFYEHGGVEWGLMRKALVENVKTRRKGRGASTITQQLVKNLYLSPKKTYARKAREVVLALDMEKELSKRRILELYLNVAEWGDGIFGAEAAARTFFGKPAADLSEEESVALAAVLPSPRRHGPLDDSKWVNHRKEWVRSQITVSGRRVRAGKKPRPMR